MTQLLNLGNLSALSLRTAASGFGPAKLAANDCIGAPHSCAHRQCGCGAIFRAGATLHTEIRIDNMCFAIFNSEHRVRTYLCANTAATAAGLIKL